ncbi:centrosome-associated protein CEP250 [Oryza brachyantha]|uniref:Uncharacterized protein n=1 Tax=Oryza brachyantha TaxID=4533 RepID=J3N870_ORYBR|nr:centrosome-associated protein CEP250 [Oryza brachyantha]
MAAARLCGDSGGDGDAAPLALSVLHDLLGVAAFVASHPLHAAYALFFARHLLALACFFCPLLLTTSLLLAVLVTVAPYVGGGGGESPPPPGVRSSLGWTCGIAVGALRAELRPDGAGTRAGGGAVALLGQLCSFVLGPGDAAAVHRVGEIMGELCDIGDSCFIPQDKSMMFDHTELGLPWHHPAIDGEISMDQEALDDEIKDGIEVKKVVLELDAPHFPSQSCSASDTSLQDMDEHEQNAIQDQSSGSPDVDGLSDGVEEKRLECDPVSVEIKKCEPAARPHSSVSRRILQWEAQASGNFKRALDEMEDNAVEFCSEESPLMGFKECNKLEDAEKRGKKSEVEEATPVAQSCGHQEEQEFKDVKECVPSEAENCSKIQQSEESRLAVLSEQEWQEEKLKIVLPEPELQDQEYKDVEPVKESQGQEQRFVQSGEEKQERQECSCVQPEEEQLQEQQECDNGVQTEEEELQEEFKDADQELAREDPLRPSTSIARRVHSRTSSENLVVGGEGSPRKEKEWKRTLACKLYEERMQLKLCRDRAVVECSDNMDMLWEAYEVGVGGGGASSAAATKRGGSKTKRGSSSKQEHSIAKGTQEQVEAEDEDDGDGDGDYDEEGSVRQLCCLQALKFSTRKMNLGGGKPSLAKISKVLRRVAALSRSGSRRSTKG